ncbi:hypothetical protein POM88_053857 [Heracleum sosnowskyi]|uniref:Pentatricopeptide repeat-containing protein n=1 Tax=Heracleum sosnowskyi TaxID=360622 RepID=A0AAD8GP24_9APIA|nr:hypothetical protein POM88_053857 [Heracleum sosnowskyi]
MYGKCFIPFGAGRVFEELGLRDEVSWCSLVFAYVNAGDINVAYSVLNRIPKRVDISSNTMIAGCARLASSDCFIYEFDFIENEDEDSGIIDKANFLSPKSLGKKIHDDRTLETTVQVG